jgi:hypothetical protein
MGMRHGSLEERTGPHGYEVSTLPYRHMIDLSHTLLSHTRRMIPAASLSSDGCFAPIDRGVSSF